MAKVKGQTEGKLEKQTESYLDALFAQLESLLRNSNYSGLPRPANGSWSQIGHTKVKVVGWVRAIVSNLRSDSVK